jgi:hypothetical protein
MVIAPPSLFSAVPVTTYHDRNLARADVDTPNAAPQELATTDALIGHRDQPLPMLVACHSTERPVLRSHA